MGAKQLGPEEGKPPAIAVLEGGKPVAWIFSTLDIVAAPGYSAVPFDIIVGVDTNGRITGAKVIFHREPYVMGDKVREPRLDYYLAQHKGASVHGGNSGMLQPDYVGGVSITARAMRAAIFDSARIVYRARVDRPAITSPTLDLDGFELQSFEELLAQGSVARRRFTNAEVASALSEAGGPGVTPEVALGPPDETYIELFTALATPAGIGRNLFGGRDHLQYLRRMTLGGQAIVIASNGVYDFLGTSYFKESKDYAFDRFRIVQGERVFTFERERFQRLGGSGRGLGIRAQSELALYYLLPQSGFDPLQPWRLDLLVQGTSKQGPVTAVLPVDYRLPAKHVLLPESDPVPAWVEAWQEARTDIIVLVVALVVLTLILAFQARISRHRLLHRLVRTGYLAFVLVWLGWTASTQLSIVNVINYLKAPIQGLDIGFYLAEPLMVIVAVYTAVSLLLLGRGVFCGWLCPFGALQELLAQIARGLGLPQWNPKEALQRKLWSLKYVSAAVVIGLAFWSVDLGATAAEIEPFKTAITSHFTRSTPYLLYAGILLLIGLFTERAYCRFLCPLGGTLALLDRLHLLDLLKRRPECGRPCRLCEQSCPVKAVQRSGKIEMAECFQCLDCQVEYYDDKRCPPLVKARRAGIGAGRDGIVPVGVTARGYATR